MIPTKRPMVPQVVIARGGEAPIATSRIFCSEGVTLPSPGSGATGILVSLERDRPRRLSCRPNGRTDSLEAGVRRPQAEIELSRVARSVHLMTSLSTRTRRGERRHERHPVLSPETHRRTHPALAQARLHRSPRRNLRATQTSQGRLHREQQAAARGDVRTRVSGPAGPTAAGRRRARPPAGRGDRPVHAGEHRAAASDAHQRIPCRARGEHPILRVSRGSGGRATRRGHVHIRCSRRKRMASPPKRDAAASRRGAA
jgi:hypothetical protein